MPFRRKAIRGKRKKPTTKTRRVWKPSERYPTREEYYAQRNLANQTKGDEGEQGLALLLRSLGFPNARQGAKGNKDIIYTQPIHAECKNVRSSMILTWMWQSIRDVTTRFSPEGYTIPTVWMKHNEQWYVMVPVNNLYQFCQEILKRRK